MSKNFYDTISRMRVQIETAQKERDRALAHYQKETNITEELQGEKIALEETVKRHLVSLCAAKDKRELQKTKVNL